MNARLILTTSCLLLQLAQTEAADWEKLPPLPEPNGGFVCGTDLQKVYVIGGTNWEGGKKNWLSSAWAYDPLKSEWKALDELKSPVAYAVSGTLNTPISNPATFHFAGGTNGTGVSELMQAVNGTGFKIMKVAMPFNTVLSSGGIVRDKMIVAGGTHDAAKLSHLSKKAWAIDLSSGEVTRLADYPGPVFGTAASATAGGQLFVFGGASWDFKSESVVNLETACALRVKTNEWQNLRFLPYAVRGLTGASIGSQFIYLAGGYKNDAEGFTDEALLYDITKDEYRPAKRLPYKAMVALVVCDDYLYCLGGEDKKQSRTDACFRIAVADLLK